MKNNRKDKVLPYKSITRGPPVKVQTGGKARVKAVAPPAKGVIVPKGQTPQGKRTLGVRQNPIPRTPATKPLKLPKGSSDPATHIQQRLKKKSPWYSSITDPIHGADAIIPDGCGVETGTVQVVQRETFTINANGVGGARILTPFVNSIPNAGGITGQNYQFASPGSSESAIVWGSTNFTAGAFAAGTAWPFDGVTELQAITEQHRVVSAALYVEHEADLASNKGEFTLFASAFNQTTAPAYNTYVNKYKSVTIPLNENRPGVVRWWPESRGDLIYNAFQPTTNPTNNLPWELGVLASGCTVDVPFRVTMVVNYEFVPVYNTLNILDADLSPDDPQEVALVEDWVKDMDIASPVSSQVANSSPSTVSPQPLQNDSGTGLGMFFNVLSEALPFALALL